MNDAFAFVLGNYTLTFFVLGLLASAVALWRRTERSLAAIVEALRQPAAWAPRRRNHIAGVRTLAARLDQRETGQPARRRAPGRIPGASR